MRRLIISAALLAIMPTANAADGKADFSHDAEYRLRYQYDQNMNLTENDGSMNTWMHRFKLGTTFRSGEKFSARLGLLHNSVLGSDMTSGDTGIATPDGTADGRNMVLVNEVYGAWMLSDHATLKFGRGGFTMADGLVVSTNDWEATPYSFDGVLYSNEMEMFRLTAFMVKFADQLVAANGESDPEINLYGVSFDWKSLPEFLKMVNIHLMQINQDTSTTTGVGESTMRYGISLGGDTSGVDYHFIYAANDGEVKNTPKTDHAGNMMQATLGYSMPEMMASRFYLTYHTDTGDDLSAGSTKDESYDTFFYEKHGNAGLMDVLAWGNLTYFTAGYSFMPMDALNVGIKYWMFSRSETNGQITGGTNASAGIGGLTGVENTKDAIGDEIDVEAGYKYDGGLSVYASLGMFMPGDYLKDTSVAGGTVKETYTQAFVQLKMAF